MMKGLMGWKGFCFGFLLLLCSATAQGQGIPGGDPEPQVLVGELPGEFSVNNLGVANYVVPLTVSPGTAGMAPKLSVGYGSRGGNGVLGVGFSLNGISTITRGGASLDQDGFIDGVDFDDNDRFLLDGQRLEIVALNGTSTTNKAFYGDAGSEYRTEIDSFSRVIAYDQAGNGPAWFKVWTKAGLIYEYGHTDDSSFEPGAHTNVLSWAVNRISDTSGNYMDFTYSTNSAGPQISRIDYTGNAAASLSTYNAVEFGYEPRPDHSLGFFMGARMEQTNRLAKITMEHNGNYLHDYRFGYTEGEAGQSLLESVQQFFGEGTEVDRLPETRFEYEERSSGTNFNYLAGDTIFPAGKRCSIANGDRFLQGDFNGDGRTDICTVGESESARWLGLSNGDGSFEFHPFTLPTTSEVALGSGGSSIQTGDFNGDGLTDICSVGIEEEWRWVGLSDGEGSFNFTEGFSVLDSELTTFTGSGGCIVFTGDFNNDGWTDLCSVGKHTIINGRNKNRWVGLSNGDGSFDYSSKYDPDGLLESGFEAFSGDGGCRVQTGDFNGDGQTDVFCMGSPDSPYGIYRWLGLSMGDGTFDFTTGTNLLSSGLEFSLATGGSELRVGDFNGDGLTDILGVGQSDEQRWLGLSDGDGTFAFTTGDTLLPDDLAAYNGEGGSSLQTGDFNGDGLMDLCATGQDEESWIGLSKGDGTLDFTSGYDVLTNGFSTYVRANGCVVRTGDFNGDGRTDLCSMGWNGMHRWTGLSKGDGKLKCSAISTSFRAETDVLYYSTGDYDGNGLPDMLGMPNILPNHADNCWLGLNTNTPARLVKVVQGFRSESEPGVATQIEYRPLTDTNTYVKGTGATYPILDVVSPMHVVSKLTKDNGQGGTYSTDYTYRSARQHMRGRGFLGFQQFESYDRQTQLATVETLAHEFPFTGRATKTETFYIPNPAGDPEASGYKERIALVENDWIFDLVDGGTLFAFNPRSVATTWELGNTNEVVTQTTSYNWFDEQDTMATPPETQPTNLFTKITYGDLSQTVVDYGGGHKQTTANSYTNWVDATHWMLGRLDESTTTHEATNQNPVVRTTAFDYYAGSGLLATETLEPGHAQFELVADYYYDDFGNVVRKRLSGPGIATRNTERNSYDSKGRYLLATTNALGHATTFLYDHALGKPLSSTDPNLQTTHWQYDPLGRPKLETRPDTTTTSTVHAWETDLSVSVPVEPGGTNSTMSAAYSITTQTSGTAPAKTYFDKLGRKIRTQTQSADGRLVNTDTGYNAIAQPIAVSQPYFVVGGIPAYAFTQYDALGRPQTIIAPDTTRTAFGYHGLVTTTTNNFGATDGPAASRNQVSVTEKNAKGETVSTTTSLVGNSLFEIQYSHDSVGNLIKTTDPDNNQIEIEYDLRGNKIRQDDPDMGEWFYTYNTLDQLVSQTNANNKVTTMEYDLLGRMTQRTAPEGVASWFFDNPGEGGKLGALWREELTDGTTNLVQRKTYAYDTLKRPMLELMNHDDKWFYTTFRYDTCSRLQHTDWFWRPQSIIDSGDDLSPNWNTFSMKYVHDADSGFLTAVKDGTDHEWWTCALSDYDEQGRVAGFEQGNGVATVVDFNPLTGIVEGMGISNIQQGILNFDFGYDRLGNLTSRSLARTSQTTLSESFGYDALNRLVGVDDASSFVVYNALGNIQSKGNSGTYTYGSSRPHAVTAANGVVYGYDNCGNMLSKTVGTNTSTIAWTSFNKPTRIERGANASDFTYNANHQRITQLTDTGGTLQKKIYIGNRMEQEESPDGSGGWTNTLTRIFVSTPSGVIGIEERTPAQITRKYLHRDHLGSVVAVSGEPTTGNAPLLAEYSFDAWGKQRNSSNWTATTNNLSTTASGDRGFTGHEMLDGIGLVHMNGRIYDQGLGRFLSPDPLIQSPGNLQSYNRYSYVMNRPLSLTDPSGFTAEGFQYRFGGSNYQLYATPITTVSLAVYDNVPGILVTESKWVPEYWIDENDEGHFMFVLETTAVFISTPPVATVASGSGRGTTRQNVHSFGDYDVYGPTKHTVDYRNHFFSSLGKDVLYGANGICASAFNFVSNVFLPAADLADQGLNAVGITEDVQISFMMSAAENNTGMMLSYLDDIIAAGARTPAWLTKLRYRPPKSGANVFRQGTFADDAVGWKGNYVKGKQWAAENPLTTPNYAKRYGLPAENTVKPDWVVGGKTTGPYTTRPAPASHNNPFNTGGGTEILPDSVRLNWFHMPD